MTSTDTIEKLIKSNTTVVFTFGNIGAGKTTLLISLYEYLFQHIGVDLNSHGNPDGIKYLVECAGELRDDNKLPPVTTTQTIKEVDWMFELNKKKSVFTFLDMAGEDLDLVNPRGSIPSSNSASRGSLHAEITKYLESGKLPVILFCIIDYERSSKDNELNHIFLNYIKGFERLNISGAAIIVTKWDKNPERNKDIQAFINKNAIATLTSLKSIVDEPYIFPFSIGELDPEDPQKVKSLNLTYCKPILQFLHSTSINKPETSDEFDDTEVLDLFSLALRTVFSIFK